MMPTTSEASTPSRSAIRRAESTRTPVVNELQLRFKPTATSDFRQPDQPSCRRKMRMSGLCKVEMSAFMDVRGPHGDGANHFEPTRTGPIESAARGTAEASFAGSGSGAAESNRPPGAADAAADSRARGWCPGSRITRPAIESQAGGPLGAEGFGSRGSALCRLRAHAGRRTLSQGWFRVEPGDSADVDDQSGLLASALPAGEKDPRVAGAKS